MGLVVSTMYIVQGELVFAPKELQYSTFNTTKPILDMAASQQKILISLLTRYLYDGCCLDPEHVSNLGEDDYQSNLEEVILTCRLNLKDFLFRQGIPGGGETGEAVSDDAGRGGETGDVDKMEVAGQVG